jgi:hypothetical protein
MPDGAGEYLFRRLGAQGRSANVFLENGALLCLRPDESDVAQPAYATPECDSIAELVAAEHAGDEILARLAAGVEESLTSEGSPATLAVSRVAAAQSAAAFADEGRYRRLNTGKTSRSTGFISNSMTNAPCAAPIPERQLRTGSAANHIDLGAACITEGGNSES